MSKIKTLKIKGHECKRCGHTWISRPGALDGRLPIICPHCKSKLWNRRKKNGDKPKSGAFQPLVFTQSSSSLNERIGDGIDS